MTVGLSWFPMALYFYEQLEAIMEMRVLSRAERSSPSDDRPLRLGPLPSQHKLNTNGLSAVTHTLTVHSVIFAQYHSTMHIPRPHALQTGLQHPRLFHT